MILILILHMFSPQCQFLRERKKWFVVIFVTIHMLTGVTSVPPVCMCMGVKFPSLSWRTLFLWNVLAVDPSFGHSTTKNTVHCVTRHSGQRFLPGLLTRLECPSAFRCKINFLTMIGLFFVIHNHLVGEERGLEV